MYQYILYAQRVIEYFMHNINKKIYLIIMIAFKNV